MRDHFTPASYARFVCCVRKASATPKWRSELVTGFSAKGPAAPAAGASVMASERAASSGTNLRTILMAQRQGTAFP